MAHERWRAGDFSVARTTSRAMGDLWREQLRNWTRMRTGEIREKITWLMATDAVEKAERVVEHV